MTLRWQEGDRVFERLVEVTEAMDDEARAAFLARLVFVLASEVGDGERVLAAIETAAAAGG